MEENMVEAQVYIPHEVTKKPEQSRRFVMFLLLAVLVFGSGVAVGTRAPQALNQILGATTGVGIRFSPGGSTTIRRGQVLTVLVNMDTKGADVTGTELVITYPSAYLSVNSITVGSFLSVLKAPTTSRGTIRMILGSNCTTICTKARGIGTLATLKFNTIKKTAGSPIRFSSQTVTSAIGQPLDATNRSSLAALNVIIK